MRHLNAGLFLIFTIVKMKGPNKPLNHKISSWFKYFTDLFCLPATSLCHILKENSQNLGLICEIGNVGNELIFKKGGRCTIACAVVNQILYKLF